MLRRRAIIVSCAHAFLRQCSTMCGAEGAAGRAMRGRWFGCFVAALFLAHLGVEAPALADPLPEASSKGAKIGIPCRVLCNPRRDECDQRLTGGKCNDLEGLGGISEKCRIECLGEREALLQKISKKNNICDLPEFRDSKVCIVQEKPKLRMPDFRGMDLQQVRNILDAMGVVYATARIGALDAAKMKLCPAHGRRNDWKAGLTVVEGQRPIPGTMVDNNRAIVFLRYTTLAEVPPQEPGDTLATYKAKAEKSGFSVFVEQEDRKIYNQKQWQCTHGYSFIVEPYISLHFRHQEKLVCREYLLITKYFYGSCVRNYKLDCYTRFGDPNKRCLLRDKI